MDAVIFVVPSARDAAFVRRLTDATGAPNEIGSFVFDDGTSGVFVFRNEHAPSELGPNVLAAFAARVADPVFYGADFSDILHCRRVVELLADDPELWVDNDHGVALPGPEFVRLMRYRPTWDWRLDTDWPRDDEE